MKEEFFMDDGTKIDPDSVPIPSLCLSCSKNQDEEVACILTRTDQLSEIQAREMFCCFAYEPIDPKINKESIYEDMENYLTSKNE